MSTINPDPPVPAGVPLLPVRRLDMNELTDWTLSALLFIAWLTLWATMRRIPWWFFVGGAALSILCFPLAENAKEASEESADGWSRGEAFTTWILNGIGGVFTLLVLGIVTIIVLIVLAAIYGPKRRDGTRRKASGRR